MGNVDKGYIYIHRRYPWYQTIQYSIAKKRIVGIPSNYGLLLYFRLYQTQNIGRSGGMQNNRKRKERKKEKESRSEEVR